MTVRMEQIKRDSRVRAGWRRLVRCAARALIITPDGTAKEEEGIGPIYPAVSIAKDEHYPAVCVAGPTLLLTP